MVKVKDNLTTINFTDKNSTARIKFIVIHYTGNNGDTAYGNTNYFKSTYRGASAHYFVDEKEIWRSVADDDIAWHCGANSYKHPTCRNTNSIGIELCSRKDSKGVYYLKPETVANGIELTKELMKKYNVPVENVIRHYEVSGKKCPEPMVRDIAQWKSFKANLITKPSEGEEEDVKRYNTVAEMPDWAKPTIQKLIDDKILSGAGNGLNLSEDMIRTLVLTQRMIDKK